MGLDDILGYSNCCTPSCIFFLLLPNSSCLGDHCLWESVWQGRKQVLWKPKIWGERGLLAKQCPEGSPYFSWPIEKFPLDWEKRWQVWSAEDLCWLPHSTTGRLQGVTEVAKRRGKQGQEQGPHGQGQMMLQVDHVGWWPKGPPLQGLGSLKKPLLHMYQERGQHVDRWSWANQQGRMGSQIQKFWKIKYFLYSWVCTLSHTKISVSMLSVPG